MDQQTEQVRVGYSRIDITPPTGVPLAGVIARQGRWCSRIRDPLCARALHLEAGGVRATVVVVDLLVITEALHRAVAARAGLEPAELLLSATHTHSAPGGYWDLGRGELIMGPYRQSTFEGLVAQLAEAAVRARAQLAPLSAIRGATLPLVGVNANRRRRHGPVDPDLSLLRLEPVGEPPIDVVSFSAHPVIGCERAPQTCSADFPGEVCGRLERRGLRPLFFTGAVGGLSPLFPEFPLKLEEHLELVAGLICRGLERAEEQLLPLQAGPLERRIIAVPVPAVSCEVCPRSGAFWRVAEAALWPLRRWLLAMGRQGRLGGAAPLHLVRLGEAALLGAPCDLGVTVALALKEVLRSQGVRIPLVGSQCDGYVGYVHLPEDYDHVPEPGFRYLALYENAMSLSGRQLGADFVSALRRVGERQPEPEAP